MRERTTRSARAILDPGYVEQADEPEFDLVPEAAALLPVRAPRTPRGGPAAGKRASMR